MHHIVTLSPTKEARCFIISALSAPYVSGNICGDPECECGLVSQDVQHWLRNKMCVRVIRRGVRGGFLWLRGVPLQAHPSNSDSEADEPSLYSIPNMEVHYRDGDPPNSFRFLHVCEQMYNSVFHICKKTHRLCREESPVTFAPESHPAFLVRSRNIIT